jgi:hypothetical protein
MTIGGVLDTWPCSVCGRALKRDEGKYVLVERKGELSKVWVCTGPHREVKG